MAQGENILPDPPCTDGHSSSRTGVAIAFSIGVKSTSLWLETAHPSRRPALERDAKADVCVIGAGIAV